LIANRPGAARERLYASTTDTFDGDLDFIAIEYALNGEQVKLTTAEKIHAARILTGRGYGVVDIARRVGVTRDTVNAWQSNGWQQGKPGPKKPRREPPKCGEPRMYRQHLRNGEKCDECRAANAAADRRYRLTGSRAGA
jgi:transposase-like protein